MEKPQPSLGIFGVLKEALKTTNRNGKLAMPILLIMFLSFSQLDLVRKFVLEPVAKDLSTCLANVGMFQDFSYIDQTTRMVACKDMRELLLVEILIVSFSCVILLLFSIATISSSSEAYTSKLLSVKDMFFKIRSSWKKPIVTSFYMSLITMGIICLYVISMTIVTIVMVGSYSSYLLYTITIISIPICYFYVSALWMMSVVVSVLEDGCNGLKAIDRAGELMKGKRVQASIIMLLFGIANGVVYLTSYGVTSGLGKWGRLAITIPFTNGVICGLKLLMFVAYTVFYHEHKMNHKEEGVKGRGDLYVPIATDEA